MNSARYAERLCKDTEALVHDTTSLLKAAGEDLKQSASGAGERLSETLQTARNTCREAQMQARRMAAEADIVIRQHPYQSLAVAFGIGVLGTLLLKRR